jgi:YidC/Oxa1 family membrane protein insertase
MAMAMQGVHVYWVTSNFFSLSQVAVLKIPAVRKALDLPDPINHPPPKTAPGQPLGFMESFRSALAANDRRLLELEVCAGWRGYRVGDRVRY